jgi:hypothetical protein
MKLSRILLLACIFIPACAPTKDKESDKEKPKPVAAGPQLVGRIASIPADRRFVLIQSYGKWTIESGRILTTRGPEARTANLRTTGETLGEFAAADLQSGLVEVGDAVYFQHVVKPVEPPTIAEPLQLPAETLPEPLPKNVQKNN